MNKRDLKIKKNFFQNLKIIYYYLNNYKKNYQYLIIII